MENVKNLKRVQLRECEAFLSLTPSTMLEVPLAGNYSGRSHAEYVNAMRHSRRVRALKVLLPLSSVLVIVVFVMVSWVDALVPQGLGVESVAIRDGKLIMQSPVMNGQNAQGRPYVMRADQAVQDLSTPDIVKLQDIVAQLPINADGKAVLNAKSGTFNRVAQTMKFDRPFTVKADSGMSVTMQSADIDMKSGSLTTNKLVSIQSAGASVVAQSMQITDKGDLITFKDKVRMTITPSALKPKDEGKN